MQVIMDKYQDNLYMAVPQYIYMNLWLEIDNRLLWIGQIAAPELQGRRFESCQGPKVAPFASVPDLV